MHSGIMQASVTMHRYWPFTHVHRSEGKVSPQHSSVPMVHSEPSSSKHTPPTSPSQTGASVVVATASLFLPFPPPLPTPPPPLAWSG